MTKTCASSTFLSSSPVICSGRIGTEYSGTNTEGSVTTNASAASSSDCSQKNDVSPLGSSRQNLVQPENPSNPFGNVITRSSAISTSPKRVVRTIIGALPILRPFLPEWL